MSKHPLRTPCTKMISARARGFFLLVLLCVSFLAAVLAQGDFYQILGVSKKSTEAQIKKAYRCVSELEQAETPEANRAPASWLSEFFQSAFVCQCV